jgi:hypothetical protein
MADFDRRAGAILGTDNIYKWEFIHGAKAFWAKLDAVPDFFEGMHMKHDAYQLWYAIQKLPITVLTALPKTGADEVDRQKRAWVAKNLGATVEVITCQTEDKPRFCEPGSILIDDRAVNRAQWIANGGVFILHTDGDVTVKVLRSMGVID